MWCDKRKPQNREYCLISACCLFLCHRVYLTESPNPYSLSVLRDKGTFGEVQINYFVLPGTATKDLDFNITGWSGPEVTLVFPDGVSEQNITIYVADDNESEGDETLQIGLTKNSAGRIGDPSTLEVVIRANDDAYGVFNLASSSLSKTISEPGTGPITEAEFQIVRSVDSYGTVVVYWEVLNVSASEDLSPVSGNVTFKDGDTQKTFKVKALLDSTPEKAETFVIKLNISGKLKIISSQIMFGRSSIRRKTSEHKYVINQIFSFVGRNTWPYRF